MENVIEIGHAKFWTDDEDILYCQFNNDDPNYQLNSEKVKLYIKAITELCNGKSMPFLIDVRHSRGTYSTSAATMVAKSPLLLGLRISEVYVFNSIGMKLLIASYKRLYDPITPFSFCIDIASAKKYCIETRNKFYGSN